MCQIVYLKVTLFMPGRVSSKMVEGESNELPPTEAVP